MNHHAGRAFAVHWSEVETWSPGSFREVAWNWPPEVIRPLSVALRRRTEVVDRGEHPLDSLTFGSLHFTGELSIRDMSSKLGVKGKLFFAHANDVVYSKIDARNGAIGIVPSTLPRVVFSSEYPIYEVNPSVASPDYVKLLFRMDSFRERINSLISGASGRKRVEPNTLESIEVPLPPLATQQAIVDHWQATQTKNAATLRAADEHEAEVKASFLKQLGLPSSKAGPKPRVFAARWSTVDAWTCNAIHLKLSQPDLTKGRYPVVLGREVLQSVQHGCSVGPSADKTSLEVLKISAATRGEYDRTQKKFIVDTEAIRRNFELKAGDVLMCRTNGTLDYVGMSALVRDDEPDLIFPDKLIRVRVNEQMLPDFLWLVLQTPPLRAQIETAARTAVGNYAIGGTDIWKFQFPLPSLSVQKKIVKEITSAREKIAVERAAAEKLAADTAREVEEMILGHLPVPTIS